MRGQAFGHDGFGNLVSQTVTKGSAPALSVAVNPANNRVVGWTYDANGNLLASGYSYDVENRLLTAPWEEYAYDGNNRRVWKRKQVGEGQYREEVYFYGVGGERLGTYRMVRNGAALVFETVADNLYFNGRLIRSGREVVAVDRLGSVRRRWNLDRGAEQRFDYWPYGQEKPSATVQEREKFGTYYRDATGLDYADQRYYASQWGRFLTADPFVSTTALASPTRGWNRYAYVEGDPVNFWDPAGLFIAVPGSPDPPPPSVPWNPHIFPALQDFVGAPGALLMVPAFWAGEVGGGAYSGFIRVRNPSKTGRSQDRIRKVMNWISENIDANRSAWLSGVKDTIAALLGDPSKPETVTIGHSDFDTRVVSAFTGNNPNQTDLPEGYAMIINNLGAFFVGSYTETGSTYRLSATGYAGGTSQAQVAILLHELAHFLNDAGSGAAGFQPDFNNPRAGAANDRLIRQHCQRTLDAASAIL